jgi:hypothetical protein
MLRVTACALVVRGAVLKGPLTRSAVRRLSAHYGTNIKPLYKSLTIQGAFDALVRGDVDLIGGVWVIGSAYNGVARSKSVDVSPCSTHVTPNTIFVSSTSTLVTPADVVAAVKAGGKVMPLPRHH